jgi:hypothetical protein
MLAIFEGRQAAQSFIEGEIARFDHSGFVPDGAQAGWCGRNDDDPFEKFHFWIDSEGPADVPPPVRERQYCGLP